jgi:hypothetical protein
VKRLGSYNLIETKKMKILLFGYIDLNTMDGSAVFLSAFASTIAQDPNIQVELLLARPIKRDILIQPLEKANNIKIINPYNDPYFTNTDEEWIRKGVLTHDEAEMLISHYWNKSNYEWLFVRSIDTVERIVKHKHIIENTLVYATGLTHLGQEVNHERYDVIKNIYEQSAYFLCQTEEMCQFVVDMLELDPITNKVALLSPMIPDVEIADREPEITNRLVYTGKFDPDWKTIPIITAFKELRREIESLTLEVAGDKFNRKEDHPDFKQEAIYLLQNTKGLNWYGALSREDAQQLMINSDIGITWRSEEMDSSLELSTKLLEYGIFKKAVIMNPTKMHLKLFGEDYPLYAVTEKDFREAIKLALTNKEIYEFAAKRMYEVSRKFVFSESLKRMQPILWGRKINKYLKTELHDGTDIYADEQSFKSLNKFVPSPLISEFKTSLSDLKGKNIFTYIINNNYGEFTKFEQLIEFSRLGEIIELEKMGIYDFLKIKISTGDFETKLQTNLPFLKMMGTEKTTDSAKGKQRNIAIPINNKRMAELKMNEIKRENKELQRQVKKLTKEKANLERKYISLSKSKMGKLTFKYWALRKKFS